MGRPGKSSNKKAKQKALKTTINFAGAVERKSNIGMAVLEFALVILLAVLFAKFAVTDRYARLWEAQSEVASLQRELDAGMEKIASSGDLSEKFYHYTWTGMSEEELNRQSRVQIAELVQYIAGQTKSVTSYALSGDRLTVNIIAPTLESVSRLTANVEERAIVRSCSIPTAQTNLLEQNSKDGVEAQIVVYIKSRSEVNGEDEFSYGATEEAAEGNSMIDAAKKVRERTQQAEDMLDENNN